ncbi:hypothetical protein AB0G06_30910 [Nonomuraea dietziae]|uniref:hypothetical protein n=1 Tax=Nonomuraea dietziae TaxID=65515 RepID=UPI00340A3044
MTVAQAHIADDQISYPEQAPDISTVFSTTNTGKKSPQVAATLSYDPELIRRQLTLPHADVAG